MSSPGHTVDERGASTLSFLQGLPPHPLDQPRFLPGWGPLSPGLTPVPLPEGP